MAERKPPKKPKKGLKLTPPVTPTKGAAKEVFKREVAAGRVSPPVQDIQRPIQLGTAPPGSRTTLQPSGQVDIKSGDTTVYGYRPETKEGAVLNRQLIQEARTREEIEAQNQFARLKAEELSRRKGELAPLEVPPIPTAPPRGITGAEQAEIAAKSAATAGSAGTAAYLITSATPVSGAAPYVSAGVTALTGLAAIYLNTESVLSRSAQQAVTQADRTRQDIKEFFPALIADANSGVSEEVIRGERTLALVHLRAAQAVLERETATKTGAKRSEGLDELGEIEDFFDYLLPSYDRRLEAAFINPNPELAEIYRVAQAQKAAGKE